MSRISTLGSAALAVALACWVTGCGDSTPTTTTSTTTTSAGHDEHGHGEEGHDHEHGEEGHDHDGHGHGEKGPRDGVLVMFEGHEAHLELVVDAKTGTVTAYPLDGHAEKELPVVGDEIEMGVNMPEADAEPVALKLKRAEGEPVKFVGQSDALKDKEKWVGALGKVNIGGKEYAKTEFKFPEGNHGH